MKWFIYTRGTVHPHRLFAFIKGVAQYGSKFFGAPFNNVLYIHQGSKLWWAWNNKEIRKTGNYIIKICGNGRKKNAHFKKLGIIFNKTIKISEKIIKLKLSDYSNKDLDKLYDYLYKNSAFALAMTGVEIDAIDIVLESFLQKMIRKELKEIDDKKFYLLYNGLSAPAYVSYINQQEMEIIKAAIEKKPNRDKAIHKKFWWTKLGWENMVPHTKSYFEKEIKKLIGKKDLKRRLKLIENQQGKIKKQRDILIKELGLSEKIKYWLEIVDKYTEYHDLRKEMQVKATYAAYLLMSEAARRFNLSKDDLEWLTYDEVRDIIKNKKADMEEIERRKKAVCILVDKRGFRIWSGDAAIKRKEKELNEKNEKMENIKEIKGMSATKGKIRAKVKVCSGAVEALQKIKKGDILVCGMTLPDYIPAMKLAKAIITDEGGITCHAAIISRELGVPCVVGTKIATRVLKDGDMVEVDAEKGIVKILKQRI